MELILSDRARYELTQRSDKLVVELELYFSCLIRKRVLFHSPGVQKSGFTSLPDLHQKLDIYFHPVMTRSCPVSNSRDDPELETFPMKRPGRIIPKYLKIDYKRKAWKGDFGYASAAV